MRKHLALFLLVAIWLVPDAALRPSWAAEAQIVGVTPASVVLAPGQSAQVILKGRALDRLAGLAVLRGGKQAAEVAAQFAGGGAKQRKIIITAGAKAAFAEDYVLVAALGRGKPVAVMRFAVRAAAAKGGQDKDADAAVAGKPPADVMQMAAPGVLTIEAPCGGASIGFDGSAGRRRANPVAFDYHTDPAEARLELCASPGWESYSWAFDPDAAAGTRGLRLEPGQGGRATVVLDLSGSDWGVPASAAANGTLTTPVRVTLTVTPSALHAAAAGGPRTARLEVPITVSQMPHVRLERWWIPDYRPGRVNQRIDAFGIVDRSGQTAPDPAVDGIVQMEARVREPQTLRVAIGTLFANAVAGTIISMEPLGQDRFRVTAQLPSVPPGARLYLRNGPVYAETQPVVSLGYYLMDADLLPSMLADLSIVIGNPTMKGKIVAFGSEEEIELPPSLIAGLVVNVNDMRAEAPDVLFQPIGDGKVQVVMILQFETGGREFIGRRTGVVVEGDIAQPRLTLTTVLKPSAAGKIASLGTTAAFTAGGYSLAVGGGIDISLLKQVIEANVNGTLNKEEKIASVGADIANGLQAVIDTLFAGVRVRDLIAMSDGRLFVDLQR